MCTKRKAGGWNFENFPIALFLLLKIYTALEKGKLLFRLNLYYIHLRYQRKGPKRMRLVGVRLGINLRLTQYVKQPSPEMEINRDVGPRLWKMLFERKIYIFSTPQNVVEYFRIYISKVQGEKKLFGAPNGSVQ